MFVLLEILGSLTSSNCVSCSFFLYLLVYMYPLGFQPPRGWSLYYISLETRKVVRKVWQRHSQRSLTLPPRFYAPDSTLLLRKVFPTEISSDFPRSCGSHAGPHYIIYHLWCCDDGRSIFYDQCNFLVKKMTPSLHFLMYRILIF